MQLVIAEKPSVAQSIAGVIGANERKDGYMEGGVDTWQDLLRAADAELYRVKAEKKKSGVQIR